jgi:hypothetical protein
MSRGSAGWVSTVPLFRDARSRVVRIALNEFLEDASPEQVGPPLAGRPGSRPVGCPPSAGRTPGAVDPQEARGAHAISSPSLVHGGFPTASSRRSSARANPS